MQSFLSSVVNISVMVFAITSMLSVGMAYSVKQVIDPLRNIKAVLRAIVANFVLVPLLTFGVIRILSLDQALEIGLFLLACAAGAPFLVKLVQAAEGDIALSAALLVLQLLITMVYMPIVVPLALPEADVNAWIIARPLLVQMLLPLGVGHVIKAYWFSTAKRLQPIMGMISTIMLIVLVILLTLANLRSILSIIGTGAILATLIILAGSFTMGYLLGRNRDSRTVLALGTAQRNIAAAMVVATQSIELPDTLVMVVTFSIIGLIALFGAAWRLRLRRRKDKGSGSERRNDHRNAPHSATADGISDPPHQR